MEVQAYLPVLIQVLIALSIAIGILVVSHIFGQRASGNYIKDAAYECGMPSLGKSHPKFAVKFYLVAMLFILFDIEVVFMLPWVMVFREMLAEGISVLLPMLFFIGLMALGITYEMKKGALEWEK